MTPLTLWDLSQVLSILQKSLFELIQYLPFYLVAITSAHKASEVASVSCKELLMVLHQDKVVHQPHPSFLPKVVSSFHLDQDIALASSCPKPQMPGNKALYTLCYQELSEVDCYNLADYIFVLP